ncbi:MAG: insulinase family protein [SAR324 cluster bacterium]|nr:insulinase family protein [SAR324 cluster bacterium]
MRKTLTLFLTLCFLTGISTSISGSGLDNADSRYPSRQYRRFLLPNQMKVMLISDPTLQHGAASLTVAVGSMSDPVERFGLAHFLEHMLFLGTVKYPEEGSYQKFVSTHDGFSNAYTADDRTNYHFEIDPEYLEEGLDRFSQFFLAPLFNPNLVEREKRAVESEHSKNIPNDFRRIYQVKRKAYEEGHPVRNFGTGNMETLEGVSREELLGFYREHYSSNQMMLAVAGPQDLDTLQNLVVPRFAAVKNRNLVEKRISAKFMKPDPRLRLMQVKTIKDTRTLTLMFPLSSTLHYYKSQPLGMLGFLIGHEGRGSLLSLLKRENLATALSAGGGISNKSFSSFDVNIQLTPKGLRNYLRVIRNVFQYLRLLRSTGLPRYVYDEVKLMSEIDYSFAEKSEGTSLVNIFSTLMMYYPMRTVEVAPYVVTEYKPRIFDSLLYNLTPQNMLAVLAAREVKSNEKEEFYGVDYSLSYRQPKWIKKWRNSKINSSLKLPEANPFLPESMEVIAYKGKLQLTHQSIVGLRREGLSAEVLKRLESVQGQLWDSWDELLNAVNVSPQVVSVDALKELLRKHALGNPQILRDDEFGKIWFQQDYRFETPKAQMMFRINSTEVYSSPRNAVLSQLYTDAIREGFNEFGYPVRLAGLEYGINVDKEGINLTFSGYSDRIPELVKTVADRLKKISIDQKTFKTLKEIRLRRYQNFHFRQPYQQAFYFRNLFLEGRKFSIFDYEKEIKKIKLKDLKKFANKLYSRIYIEGLGYGNLRVETVSEAAEVLRIKLSAKPLAKSKRFKNTVRQVNAGASYTFTRKMKVENSAVVTDIQVGQRSPELQTALMVIETLMQPQFYNDLRTSQQLGYIVNSGMSVLEKTLGLVFIIQSGEYNSETLEQRIGVFLEKFNDSLRGMTDSELNRIKKSVLNSKLQKTNSVTAEAVRLFNLAFEQNAEFDVNSREIRALEKLTREDILDLVNSYLRTSKQRKLTLRMSGKDHEAGNSAGELISSTAKFKKLYACPQHCLP